MILFSRLANDSYIAFSTTDGLPEGLTNLYFTEQRVIDVVQLNLTTQYIQEGGITNLYFTNARVINTVSTLMGTNDLQETGLTNLYFTEDRVVNAVHTHITTIDIDEAGTSNLYFTTQRVIDTIHNNITTADIPESGTTNFYFTTARARNAVIDIYESIDTLSSAFDPIGSAINVQNTLSTQISNLTTQSIPESGITNLYFNTTRLQTALDNGISTTSSLTVSGNVYLYCQNVAFGEDLPAISINNVEVLVIGK